MSIETKYTVGVGVGPGLDLRLTDDNRLLVHRNDAVMSLGTFNKKRLDFMIECLERFKIHLPD